jgi:uncharacterized membrane protein YbhN (UPF0104 family)
VGEKRPRTILRLYRRYRLLSRLAALLGGAVGIGLVAYSLLPVVMDGGRLPPTSFVVGGIIVGLMALVPYRVVRWRWRVVKATLEDD